MTCSGPGGRPRGSVAGRLSKLLLGQRTVYSGGKAWTDARDLWLRGQKFTASALKTTFESDYEAVPAVKARRERLGEVIARELAGWCWSLAVLEE